MPRKLQPRVRIRSPEGRYQRHVRLCQNQVEIPLVNARHNGIAFFLPTLHPAAIHIELGNMSLEAHFPCLADETLQACARWLSRHI